jgi:hypothetical protein
MEVNEFYLKDNTYIFSEVASAANQKVLGSKVLRIG